MLIGLTGGIACGKSTVAGMLVEKGAKLVDADAIAREVVLPGNPVLSQVSARFGQAVLQPDGSLDRKKLGSIIFSNPEAKEALEHIMHPPIREKIKASVERLQLDFPKSLVVVDIPLLFESRENWRYLPAVLVVYVPEQVQLQRLMDRDGINAEDALKRIRSQMPIEEKRKLADYVIDNSGTLHKTEAQIDDFLRTIVDS